MIRSPRPEVVARTMPLNAGVKLSLTRSDGSPVINQEGRLKDWHWGGFTSGPQASEAFVFRTGKSDQVPLGNGLFRTRWLDVLADGGWGTSFDPIWFHRYRLIVRVMQPEPVGDYSVRLVVRGGGWKSAG